MSSGALSSTQASRDLPPQKADYVLVPGPPLFSMVAHGESLILSKFQGFHFKIWVTGPAVPPHNSTGLTWESQITDILSQM